MSQILDASKHCCTTKYFNSKNDLWRVQDTRTINNLTVFCFNYLHTNFITLLSLTNTHTHYTQWYTQKATQLNVKKKPIHEHTLPSTEKRCKSKCQTNITLYATGSYRHSIDTLKNPHRKIFENTFFSDSFLSSLLEIPFCREKLYFIHFQCK